jgi:hypothetical protein
MAETLGSLVDKLTIKNIREFYLNRMISEKSGKFSAQELKNKLFLLKEQKRSLKKEVDDFLSASLKSKVVLRDEKLKLYNARKDMGCIRPTVLLSEAISGLAERNLKLWNLEDEARRKDVELSYIGGIKRKIDLCNQQRNDYMDKIDELFAKKINALKKSSR